MVYLRFWRCFLTGEGARGKHATAENKRAALERYNCVVTDYWLIILYWLSLIPCLASSHLLSNAGSPGLPYLNKQPLDHWGSFYSNQQFGKFKSYSPQYVLIHRPWMKKCRLCSRRQHEISRNAFKNIVMIVKTLRPHSHCKQKSLQNVLPRCASDPIYQNSVNSTLYPI